MKQPPLIVIGGLNTDIVAKGVRKFPGPGEHTYGKGLYIGPGGKSRNIAAMAGALLSKGQVAMIGRTTKDSFGLWKLPLESLELSGVNSSFVHIIPAHETDKLPAIALITVNETGENQIIVLPGISEDFDTSDIDRAQALFDEASSSAGLLCATFECPPDTVEYAFAKAKAMNIRALFDPGGIESKEQAIKLLKSGVFLIKPNEHEAQIITGIDIRDLQTAQKAADKLLELGAENVMITHAEHGAYLFTDEGQGIHIPTDPRITGNTKDATGCGDQTMAVLVAALQSGKSLEDAARAAVAAGTMQFYKSGIQPITAAELASSGHKL